MDRNLCGFIPVFNWSRHLVTRNILLKVSSSTTEFRQKLTSEFHGFFHPKTLFFSSLVKVETLDYELIGGSKDICLGEFVDYLLQ